MIILVICQKFRAKFRFHGFVSFFGTFVKKVAQTLFVLHETSHKKLFGIYYCVEVVKFKIRVICQKLRSKFRFYGFLIFFCAFAYNVAQTWFPFHTTCTQFNTFAHKVAETWFILHETWHTTLFRIHYCVKVVRIENHSHMLEIKC